MYLTGGDNSVLYVTIIVSSQCMSGGKSHGVRNKEMVIGELIGKNVLNCRHG